MASAMAMNFIDDEVERIRALLTLERDLWANGVRWIAGVDEAGRGPLAGPVVAAAVIFPPRIFIPNINDSKLLSPGCRAELYDLITTAALDVGIGQASPREIDRLNILQASLLAMKRAVYALSLTPDYVLIDGRYELPNSRIPQSALVKGDRRCFSIAAASIVAKVSRDRIMQDYHRSYPQYHFNRHKGYPTKIHVEAIKKFGYCVIHRRSFKVKLEQ